MNAIIPVEQGVYSLALTFPPTIPTLQITYIQTTLQQIQESTLPNCPSNTHRPYHWQYPSPSHFPASVTHPLPCLRLYPVGQVVADFYGKLGPIQRLHLLQQRSLKSHGLLPQCHLSARSKQTLEGEEEKQGNSLAGSQLKYQWIIDH